MQHAPLIKVAKKKKKCCTRFWSFHFHLYWVKKARHWFYLASNCETGLNLLSLHHRSSFLSWLKFKFRSTFATLAKYKFSLMFPDVTEDLHTIYCACMCLCAFERARIHALLFFLYCMSVRMELRRTAVVHCFNPDVSDGKWLGSWGYTEC